MTMMMMMEEMNTLNIKLASRRAKKVTYFGHKLSEKNKFPIDWHQFSIFLTTLRAVDDAFGITIQ